MAYTRYGPWTDGTAPGIAAEFLNPVEDVLVALNSAATDSNISALVGILTVLGMKINPTPVAVSGSVSGSVNLYQLFSGNIKLVAAYYNNYRSAAAQTLALPTAFTTTSYWWTMDLQTGKAEALLSGTPQTFSVLTAIGISGGTQNPQTWLNGWSQGGCRAGFDTLRITVTSASATGLVVMLGV
jgi:hypothetical protein